MRGVWSIVHDDYTREVAFISGDGLEIFMLHLNQQSLNCG